MTKSNLDLSKDTLLICIDQELLTKAYRIKEQVESLKTEFDKKIEEYKKK